MKKKQKKRKKKKKKKKKNKNKKDKRKVNKIRKSSKQQRKNKLVKKKKKNKYKKLKKVNYQQKIKKEESLGQWLIGQGISAGFPSPADDFKEVRISLDEELVNNNESTFYARVSGDSMENAGLSDGDLIIIDRSMNPENKKIAY